MLPEPCRLAIRPAGMAKQPPSRVRAGAAARRNRMPRTATRQAIRSRSGSDCRASSAMAHPPASASSRVRVRTKPFIPAWRANSRASRAESSKVLCPASTDWSTCSVTSVPRPKHIGPSIGSLSMTGRESMRTIERTWRARLGISAVGIEIEQRMQRIGAAAFLGKAEEVQRELRDQPPGKIVGARLALGARRQRGRDGRLRRAQRTEQPDRFDRIAALQRQGRECRRGSADRGWCKAP